MRLKQRIYAELHGQAHQRLTNTQRLLVAVILFAVVLAIVGTEPDLPKYVQLFVEWAEVAVGVLFLLEYVVRIWTIGVATEFSGFRGRLRYIAKPYVLLDLVALLPFLIGAIGAESLLLRLIRVMRLLAISKFIRYSNAMQIVVSSVVKRRYELLFAMMLAGLMILFCSAALYVLEGETQPKAFGSILRSMWWAAMTLTTVGYGDVVPVTPLGKVLAALTAIAGVGMIAMPTGILAASFAEGFAQARSTQSERIRENSLEGTTHHEGADI